MRNSINTVVAMIFGMLLSTDQSLALDNNALYQWKSQDGTPTYSPEPPPAGVDYVIVDADLNPLPVQPPKTEPAVAAAITPPPPAAALAAPVKKSIPKWKPVRYAQDPSVQTGKQTRGLQNPTQSPSIPAVITTTNQPDNGTDVECWRLKQETQVEESYFAATTTSAEMDQAMIRLQRKTEAYQRYCR